MYHSRLDLRSWDVLCLISDLLIPASPENGGAGFSPCTDFALHLPLRCSFPTKSQNYRTNIAVMGPTSVAFNYHNSDLEGDNLVSKCSCIIQTSRCKLCMMYTRWMTITNDATSKGHAVRGVAYRTRYNL